MKDINLHSAVCMVVMLLLASCNSTFTRHNFLAYDIDEVGVTHIDIREDIFDVKIEPSWSDTLSVEVYAENITMSGMAGFEKLIKNEGLYEIERDSTRMEIRNSRSMTRGVKESKGEMTVKIPPGVTYVRVSSKRSDVRAEEVEFDTLEIYAMRGSVLLENCKVENPHIRCERVIMIDK
ncbi:MAG: hypothetical protein IKT29_07740 [Flavobacteriales bacterium]|nr:hypothetical protein [Flavobacteriales bacterium]